MVNTGGSFWPGLSGLIKEAVVLVAVGQSPNGRHWSLSWPLDHWVNLDPAEQAAAIDRQAALLGPVVWSRLEETHEKSTRINRPGRTVTCGY